MAGTIKVDRVQSDSNLAFNIAGSNVAFMNATSLQMVGNNISLAGTNVISSGRVVSSGMPAGSVLQVVNVLYGTGTSTTSTSFVDTGLTATITPTSSTSKILVCVAQTLSSTTSGSNTYGAWRVLRDATQIYTDPRTNMYMQYAHGTYTCFVLDTPATTSATTYKTQMYTGAGIYVIEAQHASLRGSTITLLEIAG